MDSFNIHGIKVEKANAIFKHNKLQTLTVLFRFMELCVFLIILSRSSSHLPFASKLCGECFRGVFVTLISPRSVFVIGNAIIVILVLKSGHLSAKDGVYDEYMENCQKNKIACRKYTWSCDQKERKIHRSESEKKERMHTEEPHRELRRSMTESCRKSVNCCKKPVATSCAKDELSNEEFRRTVEDFIARQQKILREEEEID